MPEGQQRQGQLRLPLASPGQSVERAPQPEARVLRDRAGRPIDDEAIMRAVLKAEDAAIGRALAKAKRAQQRRQWLRG